MKKYCVVALAVLMTTLAIAKDNDRHQHDAHEHGVAEMNIAWVKSDLSIEIESPSYNIVGFEHQPKSNEQLQKVSKAAEVLQQPSQLFSIDNTSCKVSESHIESPFESTDDKHGHHHDKEHKEHKEHKESTHSEYSMHYEFDCSEQTTALTVDFQPLFKQFPKLQKVQVQWLSAAQQNSEVITLNNAKLILK